MLIFGIVSPRMGGTSVLRSWFHNSCLNISVLSCCCVVYMCHCWHGICVFKNDLYVVV
jgi:hypothetical protein